MENLTDSELMKDTRTKLGLTQTEMAEMLNYNNQQAISNIETGFKGLSGVARKALYLIRKYEL